MRIAVVIHAHQPQSGGGYTFNRTIIERLQAFAAASDHEFVYYSAGGSLDDPPGCIEIPATRSARFRGGLIELWRDLHVRAGTHARRMRTWLEQSLDANRVDLVWFVSSYLAECDRPFVATVWDLAHLEQPWFPEVSAGGEWQRRQHAHHAYLPRATRVIVPNAAGREQLARHFGIAGERVLELPHPTPPFVFEETARQAVVEDVLARHDVRQPYLFYPAQYWAHKNHYNLLRSLAESNRRGAGLNLVCVGSSQGQRRHVEETVADLGLTDQVRLLDFVSPEDLVALYRGAHALVYLSFFGPENLPPLEAFALGCPVVYGDIPGAREQLGDAALLADPQDPAAIADAIAQLDDPATRERLVAAGEQRAAELNPDAYVAAVTKFFDEFESVRRCWAPTGGPA